MKMGKMNVNLVLGMVFLMILMASVDSFTHIVGGSHGWRVPDNTSFFEEWAKPRTFGVGDKLVFPYRPGSNNIVVVNETDFKNCGDEHVIFMYFMGPTIINFTAPGDHYYYCGIGKHCESGQKLHVHVTSATGSSGSDPLPFDLADVGVDHPSLSAVATESPPSPAPSANLPHLSAAATTAGKLAGIFFTCSFVLSFFFF